MKSATFHRLAERELAEAAEYYEDKKRGLGAEFLAEIEHAKATLFTHQTHSIRGAH